MATLEESRQAVLTYSGSVREENYGNSDTWRWDKPGWVFYQGNVVRLAEGAYDLRANIQYLAQKHGHISHCNYVSTSFQASHSRAVKGLIKRGNLKKLSLVPVVEFDPEKSDLVHELSDGDYLSIRDCQCRFVQVSDNVHNT